MGERVGMKRSMGLEHRLLGIASSALRKAGWRCHRAGNALYEKAACLENGFDQSAMALIISAIAIIGTRLADASIAIDSRRIAIANRVLEHNQHVLDELSPTTPKGGE